MPWPTSATLTLVSGMKPMPWMTNPVTASPEGWSSTSLGVLLVPVGSVLGGGRRAGTAAELGSEPEPETSAGSTLGPRYAPAGDQDGRAGHAAGRDETDPGAATRPASGWDPADPSRNRGRRPAAGRTGWRPPVRAARRLLSPLDAPWRGPGRGSWDRSAVCEAEVGSSEVGSSLAVSMDPGLRAALVARDQGHG